MGLEESETSTNVKLFLVPALWVLFCEMSSQNRFWETTGQLDFPPQNLDSVLEYSMRMLLGLSKQIQRACACWKGQQRGFVLSNGLHTSRL